ncbi:nucleoside-diphosphate kinase [Candidatus Woesearchaeota archaeon]|nr:nucleoside-diphosphate kinase [Candidatus Woesearchaeota archaeon]
MIERTLVVIKPDGVQRKLVGKITARFEDIGLKIVGMKMIWLDRDFSKKHYAAHVKKPFYKYLEDFIVAGPVVAMVLEGVHAVDTVRKHTGATEPFAAAPGTIRGDYAHHSYKHSDKKKIAVKNIIHASETSADAKKEISLWFPEKELHSYKTTDENHVF